MSRPRGQAGLEFLVLTLFLLLILTFVVFSYNYNRSAYFQRDTELQIRSVERSVAYGVASAVLEGDGFSTKVAMPPSIGAKNYTAIITDSTLFIKLNDSEYAHSTVLLTGNITGSLSPGERTISNVGGMIKIV